MPAVDKEEWSQFLSHHPHAHILQSAAWGELKAAFGWRIQRVVCSTAGAQILFRRLPFGQSFGYIPKAPVGENWSRLWPEVDRICRAMRTTFLKVEADCWHTSPDARDIEIPAGFHPSPQGIQPRSTLVVDLRGSEDEILARMKGKTRYNIRLAARKGVTVRGWSDFDRFYQLIETTSRRDHFAVHHQAYYEKAYELFHSNGRCELFFAEYQETPLAAIMVFQHGKRAWYFYGASSDHHRNLMPTYLLQWEGMRWARSHGCLEYDLWGIPDTDYASLERQFTQRSDGLWGVYRFKRGFGGELRRAVEPWDRVYKPLLYIFYQWWVRTQPSTDS